MPLFIDPQWEYWCPSLEEEEKLDRGDLLLMELSSHDQEKGSFQANKTTPGFRLGKGNPDSFWAYKLKPAKSKEPRGLDKKPCKGCGDLFQPSRSSREYCKLACFLKYGAGSEKVLEDKICPSCKTTFHPKHAKQTYCKVTCARKTQPERRKLDEEKLLELYQAKVPVKEIAKLFQASLRTIRRRLKKLDAIRRPGKKPRERDQERLKELYLANTPMEEIAKVLGIDRTTAQRRLKKMGVVRRPPGNHRRK